LNESRLFGELQENEEAKKRVEGELVSKGPGFPTRALAPFSDGGGGEVAMHGDVLVGRRQR
jgi:hypothetical protein